MKTRPRVRSISSLPGSRYRVTSPILVDIYRVSWGYKAVAPELGMWVDGSGSTEEEAIRDLSSAIIDQRYSIGLRPDSECSEYARAVKRTFEERLVEG